MIYSIILKLINQIKNEIKNPRESPEIKSAEAKIIDLILVSFLFIFVLGGIREFFNSPFAISFNLFSEKLENSGLTKNNAFSKYSLLVSVISNTCLFIPFIIKNLLKCDSFIV